MVINKSTGNLDHLKSGIPKATDVYTSDELIKMEVKGRYDNDGIWITNTSTDNLDHLKSCIPKATDVYTSDELIKIEPRKLI